MQSGVWPFLLVVSLCYLILQYLNIFIPVQYIDLAKDYQIDKKINYITNTVSTNNSGDIIGIRDGLEQHGTISNGSGDIASKSKNKHRKSSSVYTF